MTWTAETKRKFVLNRQEGVARMVSDHGYR
jgi:hypothetical protein